MLSIIIPVLNEAGTIEKTLAHLCAHCSNKKNTEIIVVDGGSKDNTLSLVNKFAQRQTAPILSIHQAGRGRAKQMNAGAAVAKGSILYFLHADSLPPIGFDEMIRSEIEQGKKAGCFRMKFDESHALLRFSQWFTRFNFKACRGGDQSLFVTGEIFDSLKGFNEDFEIYEDCEFIGRIYDRYKFTVINDYVVTSARRYNSNGTWRLQYHFAMIHLLKWTGASATKLHRYYLRHIS